jgi:transcriptional antiterminator NusG
MDWYILQVYSGFENKVAESIMDLAKKRDLLDNIAEILIPTQDVIQLRYGKKINVKRKFLPGYVLLNIKLTEDLLYLIKSIPRVSIFVGNTNKEGVPYPVTQEEIDKLMLNATDLGSQNKEVEIIFDLGEVVNIINGPFTSFSGTIENIDTERKKLNVSVSIFGRATPVELEYHQVEKTKI